MSKYRTIDIEKLTGMFKALSNQQRLRIFLKLARCCAPINYCDADKESMRRCVGELGEDLRLAASTVSHHIKELQRSGLMNVERCGQKVNCWISKDILLQLADFFTNAGKRDE